MQSVRTTGCGTTLQSSVCVCASASHATAVRAGSRTLPHAHAAPRSPFGTMADIKHNNNALINRLDHKYSNMR